jgi:hypothetical protein
MGNKTFRNLALTTSLAGALAWLTFYQPGADVATKAVPLLNLAPADVTEIALERPRKPTVRLVARDGMWRVAAPFDVVANNTRAAALAAFGALIPKRSYPTAQINLVDAGLNPPKHVLRLNDETLNIGKNDPVEGLRYVQVGDWIHLVAEASAHHLAATPESYADVRPLGPTARLVTIELPEFRVERTDSGVKVTPQKNDVSADAGAALLTRWETASAMMVEPLNLALRWGQSVTATTLGGDERRFIVARTASAVYLGRQDLSIQYRLPNAPGAALLKLETD